MKIATWNVNSINARMHAVIEWLKTTNPDVVCLQEIKTIDETFPRLEIETLGYNIETHGQKSYNGVAILSKYPIEEVKTKLPGDDNDEQSRYIEAIIAGPKKLFRVASIYLPNGNPVFDENCIFTKKYEYKLNWMRRLKDHVAILLNDELPTVLAGDYNVIPGNKDVYDYKSWIGDAAFRKETHFHWRSLLNLGLTEAFEQMDNRPGQYTFWDYQRGAWQNNHGIRIDHILLSAQAADTIIDLVIDKNVRDGIKPSDHVPVIGTFDL